MPWKCRARLARHREFHGLLNPELEQRFARDLQLLTLLGRSNYPTKMMAPVTMTRINPQVPRREPISRFCRINGEGTFAVSGLRLPNS